MAFLDFAVEFAVPADGGQEVGDVLLVAALAVHLFDFLALEVVDAIAAAGDAQRPFLAVEHDVGLGGIGLGATAKAFPSNRFVAGELDSVIAMYRGAFDALEQSTPNLRKKVLLPGAGHWIQQERPVEVNRLLLEFLAELDL